MLTERSRFPRPLPILLALALLPGCELPTGFEEDPLGREAMDSLDKDLFGRTGCTVDIDGSNSACRSELDWRNIVATTCKVHGLGLVGFKTWSDCGPGKHRYVAYACCPEAVPPKDPPPGEPMCKDIRLGDGMTCIDAGTWKMKASATCEAGKQTLSKLAFGTSCGGEKFTSALATCCTASPPPPPPPPMCNRQKLGDPNVCRGLEEWKQLATRQCLSMKQTLSELKGVAVCGMDGRQFSSVEFSCCPEGGGGGGACFSSALSSRMCVDQAALKMEAAGICATKGYQLADIGYGTACDMAGNYRDAKFTCCP